MIHFTATDGELYRHRRFGGDDKRTGAGFHVILPVSTKHKERLTYQNGSQPHYIVVELLPDGNDRYFEK